MKRSAKFLIMLLTLSVILSAMPGYADYYVQRYEAGVEESTFEDGEYYVQTQPKEEKSVENPPAATTTNYYTYPYYPAYNTMSSYSITVPGYLPGLYPRYPGFNPYPPPPPPPPPPKGGVNPPPPPHAQNNHGKLSSPVSPGYPVTGTPGARYYPQTPQYFPQGFQNPSTTR